MNNNELFQQIKILKGLSVIQVGFAADMLCILFVNKETKKSFIGAWSEIGDYALHVQCMWRFSRDGEIILTYWDLYNASLKDDKETTKSIFVPLNENMPLEVIDISLYDIGTFQIKLDNNITFDVFPDLGGEVEHWRLINFKTDEHLVFYEEE